MLRGLEACVEEFGVEEIVDGDVSMGGYGEGEYPAEGGVEVALQVVHQL